MKDTGNIILNQLRTMDKMALWAWGAQNFLKGGPTKVHDGFLRFTVVNCPRVANKTLVKITLEYNDTYTVKVYKVRKVRGKNELQEKVVCEAKEVYWETLIETIDRIVG